MVLAVWFFTAVVAEWLVHHVLGGARDRSRRRSLREVLVGPSAMLRAANAENMRFLQRPGSNFILLKSVN